MADLQRHRGIASYWRTKFDRSLREVLFKHHRQWTCQLQDSHLLIMCADFFIWIGDPFSYSWCWLGMCPNEEAQLNCQLWELGKGLARLKVLKLGHWAAWTFAWYLFNDEDREMRYWRYILPRVLSHMWSATAPCGDERRAGIIDGFSFVYCVLFVVRNFLT